MTHLPDRVMWPCLLVGLFLSPVAAWGAEPLPRQVALSAVARNNTWFESVVKYKLVYTSRYGWKDAGPIQVRTVAKIKFPDGTRSVFEASDYYDRSGVISNLLTPSGNYDLFPGQKIALRAPDSPPSKAAPIKGKPSADPNRIFHPFLAGGSELSPDGKLSVEADKDSFAEATTMVRDEWTSATQKVILASIVDFVPQKRTPTVNGHSVAPVIGVRWFRDADGVMLRFVVLDADGTVLLEEKVTGVDVGDKVDDAIFTVPGEYSVVRSNTNDEYAKLLIDFASKSTAKSGK